MDRELTPEESMIVKKMTAEIITVMREAKIKYPDIVFDDVEVECDRVILKSREK